MGKGRKTGTLSAKEKHAVNWTRNMPADKLAAMIFGCKNHTIAECLDKEIFGLPAAHYSYVKNITPGLPLFLFNYSDRMLHGIFEATSPGQLNISRQAWITSEGAPITPYPAQVRVRVRNKCRPLAEAEFKRIIAKNYYEERLFWFELDKEQNRKLTKLFLLSPLPEKTPRPPNAALEDNISYEEFTNIDSEGNSGTTEMLQENEHSYALPCNKDDCAPQKKWTDLFKASSSMYALKNGEVLDTDKVTSNSSISDFIDLESSKLPLEASVDSTHTEGDSSVVEYWDDLSFVDSYLNKTYENEVACSQYHDTGSDMKDLSEIPSSECMTILDGKVGKSKFPVFESLLDKETGEAYIDTNEGVSYDIALAPQEDCKRDHNQPNLTNSAFLEDKAAASGGVLMGIQSSDSHYVIAKLLQEIEGLKVSQLEQMHQIESLKCELVDSKLEIDQLKARCHKLESVPSFAMDHCDIECSTFSNFMTEETAFIVGGFDGYSWLSDLSSYSPSQDHVIQHCPMAFPRSYASVAKLNDEIYIFGGAHGKEWFDIVESYNPISNQWVKRPSLNKRRGSLSGASIYEKIFAIGGGDGVDCFYDVELYDSNIGSWIFTKSMREKRFAPAAAAINGAVYASGGYDGKNYLRSVERFDPREDSWTSLCSMNMKRGCHSLVAYKEKLYAVGGYDGDKMESSAEVLDPRFGSWTVEAPMAISRGYFCSFVLGGNLYVAGGVQNGKILDVTECYKEGSGWQVMGTKALGKRSFCSALVL